MKNYNDFVSDAPRAYREALIFQLINTTDKTNPDAADENYEIPPLTIDQKKRLRNQIYRNAYYAVQEFNDNLAADKALGNRLDEQPKTVNDTDVVIDAFFDTAYGKAYASQKASWQEGGENRTKYEPILHDWTDGKTDAEAIRWVISPYDPRFANSTIFNDNGVEAPNDDIGYIVGKFDENGNAVVSAKTGKPVASKNTMDVNANGLYIRAVHLGHNQEIAPASEAPRIFTEPTRDIEGALERSGYTTISHFIKDRQSAKVLRAALLEQEKEHGPMSEEELAFMQDVFNFLAEKGLDFEVSMDRQNKLSVKVDDSVKTQIRLIDREDPKYQGRIYAKNTISYCSAGQTHDELITRADRMNMLRWYYGESPTVDTADCDDQCKNGTVRVGQHKVLYSPRIYGKKKGLSFVKRGKGSRTSESSSIVLAMRNLETEYNGRQYTNLLPVNIITTQQNDYAQSDSAIFVRDLVISDDVFSVPEKFAEKVAPRIPVEKAYPSDTHMEGDMLVLNDTVAPEHYNYYRHLIAREKLSSWAEKAKSNYKDILDVEGIIEAYNQSLTFPDYTYDFSDDRDIAAVQKKYWDALTGEISRISLSLDAENANNFIDCGDTTSSRIEAVREHADRYVEELFGSVPELQREGIPVRNTSKGFSPLMVAKYLDTEDNINIARTTDYMKYMMLRLENDYDDNFIREGEYADNQTKNELLRFDPNRVVGSFIFPEISMNGNIIPSKVEALKNSDAFKNKPVTLDMLVHTAKSLTDSGFVPNSIKVAVDENGIISWSGVQSLRKEPNVEVKGSNGRTQYRFNDYDPKVNYPNTVVNNNTDFVRMSGTIGQIFEPDRYGAIHTNYAVPDGKVLIPGYDAYVLPEDGENPSSMLDRLRLVGWEQSMKTAISQQIHMAAFMPLTDYIFSPHSTDLNYVYRHSYDTTLDATEYAEHLPKYVTPSRQTAEEKTYINVLRTLSGRCRFPNAYGEGATTMAQSMLENPTSDESRNFDFYYSDLVDNENLRVLGEFFDGAFDENMTATAKNQGLVRYLVDEASVDNETGKVTPAPRGRGHRKPQCALMKDPLFKEKYFDTWDRRLMASTQVLTALHTPRNVGVAMMNMKGWNFDDGFLVSKKFAESNKIHIDAKYAREHGITETMRPLMAQDKLSDMHGNKGVISKVIDPLLATDEIVQRLAIDRTVDTSGLNFNDSELKETDVILDGQTYHVTFDSKSDETHEEQAAHQIQAIFGVKGMDDIMHAFRDNPNMDVVMAPYSTMSRFNGGSIRQLMNPDTEHGYEVQDITIDGKTFSGALSFTDLVVVDMPADVKTHFYDKEAILQGQGRKASSQLAWALQAKGADAIMREFYGENNTAIDNLREYAISLGLDFDTDMVPEVGYQPQTERNEMRTLHKLIDEETLKSLEFNDKAFAKDKVYLKDDVNRALKSEMLAKLNESGGFMELPFPLEFKTKAYTNKTSSMIDDSWFTLAKTGQTYTIGGNTYETYGMPVLPQNLRCGQEFQDGTAKVHEYTTKYLDIYSNAVMYMACQNALLTETDEHRRALLEEKMSSCIATAQSKFDEVTSDIAANRFNTKYNVVREEVMANRIGHSATAVWSADPRLDIDQISMSSAHAQELGLMKDGKLVDKASVLVWRDPILHEGNVRYLNVTIDDSINGVAINPVMDQSFDGDFDGDSVAIVPLVTEAARRQAANLFSVESNLLNRGVKDSDGLYPIYCQSGLDVASNAYTNPKIMSSFNQLKIKINELEQKADALAADPTNKELADAITCTVYSKRDGKDIVQTGEKALRTLRKQYKDELNSWAHVALDGIGTDYINFTDEKTVMSSLQHIVDTGAKGSQSKLRNAAENMGITYGVGADKRVDLDTISVLRDKQGNPVSAATFSGKQREVDKQIQETAAYKADNTALGGTIAQRGVAAFRDVDLQAALELTYPVTQAILQSKHDPQDAKTKDKIVRYWGQDCWDGYLLTGDWTNPDGLSSDELAIRLQEQPHQRVKEFVLDPNGNKIPMTVRQPRLNADGEVILDTDGKPTYEWVEKTDRDGNTVYQQAYVKCNKEQWVAQMKGMMTAFKVDCNPEYIERLGDAMLRDKDVPLVSTYGTDSYITYYDKENKCAKPVMGNAGTIAGLQDYARENGTLMDSVAYFDRCTALMDDALMHYDPYRAIVSQKNMSYILRDGVPRSILTDGISQGVKAKEFEVERIKYPKRPKTEEAIATVAKLDAALNEVRGNMSRSATFTPNSVVNERYGDYQREKTGATENTFVRIKKGELYEYTSAPKAIGCKGSFLRKEDYEAGATFMGEPQAAYEARLNSIKAQQVTPEPEAKVEPTVTVEVEATPTPVAVEPTAAVVETAKPKKTCDQKAVVDSEFGGIIDNANNAEKAKSQNGSEVPSDDSSNT